MSFMHPMQNRQFVDRTENTEFRLATEKNALIDSTEQKELTTKKPRMALTAQNPRMAFLEYAEKSAYWLLTEYRAFLHPLQLSLAALSPASPPDEQKQHSTYCASTGGDHVMENLAAAIPPF